MRSCNRTRALDVSFRSQAAVGKNAGLCDNDVLTSCHSQAQGCRTCRAALLPADYALLPRLRQLLVAAVAGLLATVLKATGLLAVASNAPGTADATGLLGVDAAGVVAIARGRAGLALGVAALQAADACQPLRLPDQSVQALCPTLFAACR